MTMDTVPHADRDIVRAPPRGVLAVRLAGIAVCAMVIVLGSRLSLGPWLRQWIASAQGAERLQRIQSASAVFFLVTLLVAGWIFRRGYLMIRLAQVPLPDALVLRDTPVRRGTYARRVGAGLLALAVLLMLLAMFVVLIPYLYGSARLNVPGH